MQISNPAFPPAFKVEKVLQEDTHGCGVACLAMVAGISYSAARATFLRLGFGPGRNRKPPFASNFKDLMSGLGEHGISSEMKRWRTWSDIEGVSILKVENGRKNSWHWVVAEAHPLYKVVIHDPDLDLPVFMCPPPGVNTRPFTAFKPYGNWIRIVE